MIWEYTQSEALDSKKFIDVCNDLGKEQWELIDVEFVHGFVIGFFKRPSE